MNFHPRVPRVLSSSLWFCHQVILVSLPLAFTDVPPTESSIFPGVCPEDSQVDYQQSASWLPFRGHCYLFMTDEIEWADAASSCVRHGKRWILRTFNVWWLHNKCCWTYVLLSLFVGEGGILASIEDPDEQKFIKTHVEIFQDGHSAFWIGLFKTHKGMITSFMCILK